MDITILQHAKDNSPGRLSIEEASALIRGENRPESYQPLMVVASVLEGGRQKKHIRWLTGLAVAHITPIGKDRLDDARQTADEDLHTMLCFTDEQGDGLYVVYPFELFDGYQLEKQMQYYPKVFAWGSDYYAQLLGVQADRTCGGVTRAIPMTLDPEVIYNASAMLIFIGKQGRYKTTWFNYLLPPELQQYFCTKVDSGKMEKDDRLKLSQYGLICCDELDAFNNVDMNKIKSIMTMRFTDERMPFDRYPEHRKHIASFCGTGNNVIFLKDSTGTRRFLPFEVERIDDPRTHPINYEGIYSQTYALYQQGFMYYFTEEEEKVLQQHNKRFETPRSEEDLIDYYFRKPKDSEVGEVLPVTIAQQIVCTSANRVTTEGLARAFSNLGYEYAENGGGYRLVQRSKEEREQRASSLAYEARHGVQSAKDSE